MVQEGGSRDGGQVAKHARWVLDAIAKIKYQKQRPNEQRIGNILISQHHVSPEDVPELLQGAVDSGSVLAVLNKGEMTYKDPKTVSQLQTRTMEVTPDTDMLKVMVRCLKEMGEEQWTPVKSLENFMRSSYNLKLKEGANLSLLVKMQVKRAVNNGVLKQDGATVKLVPPPKSEKKADLIRSINKKTVTVDVEDIASCSPYEVILPFERNKVGYCSSILMLLHF
jgi:hypothetical protein